MRYCASLSCKAARLHSYSFERSIFILNHTLFLKNVSQHFQGDSCELKVTRFIKCLCMLSPLTRFLLVKIANQHFFFQCLHISKRKKCLGIQFLIKITVLPVFKHCKYPSTFELHHV